MFSIVIILFGHYLWNSIKDTYSTKKTKDLVYDKEKQEIVEIPSLVFYTESHNFTLKNTDKSRVSTLKSLTPRPKKTEKVPVSIVESSTTNG